jgi:hypothetical protein
MKHSLFLGVSVGLALLAGVASAQDSGRQMLCPKPTYVTLTASAPSVFNADFSSASLGAPRAWLNNTAINHTFLYSFLWKPPVGKCCSNIISATLTVQLKSNQPGSSKTAADAGNDIISIVRNGAGVPGYGGPIYSSFPFPVNQPTTKTFVLTGAELANINTDNRLSFAVEDDTRVVSATLQLARCCLS